MLSILVPVYNYEVGGLAETLQRQASKTVKDFEILIFDDGSGGETAKKNLPLNKLEKVVFKMLPRNVGLSQNRNLLAGASQYKYLLFIDGDSILKENFIQNYLDHITPETEVIYGGREHPSNFPDKKQSLRWQYGREIEDKTAVERQKKPYASTLFNNALMHKSVFEQINFDQNLTKYGHEDTLFSYELKKKKIKVQHIDNPVIHGDIDSNQVFLNKTTTGLANLKTLYVEGKIAPEYVRLLSFYESLKKFHLGASVAFFFKLFEKPMKKKLLSKRPSLFIFTLYKLGYFCNINRT